MQRPRVRKKLPPPPPPEFEENKCHYYYKPPWIQNPNGASAMLCTKALRQNTHSITRNKRNPFWHNALDGCTTYNNCIWIPE